MGRVHCRSVSHPYSIKPQLSSSGLSSKVHSSDFAHGPCRKSPECKSPDRNHNSRFDPLLPGPFRAAEELSGSFLLRHRRYSFLNYFLSVSFSGTSKGNLSLSLSFPLSSWNQAWLIERSSTSSVEMPTALLKVGVHSCSHQPFSIAIQRFKLPLICIFKK